MIQKLSSQIQAKCGGIIPGLNRLGQEDHEVGGQPESRETLSHNTELNCNERNQRASVLAPSVPQPCQDALLTVFHIVNAALRVC